MSFVVMEKASVILYQRLHARRNEDLTKLTGWKCCKPRVLTFDEFMTIPPCTTGTHSTIDDTPAPEPKPSNEEVEAKIAAQNQKAAQAAQQADTLTPAVARVAVASASQTPRASSPAPPEDEDDDPSLPVPDGASCKRRGCGATYTATTAEGREGEQCIHHPGQALFHEGSKGWTCCKKRVLEFDEFMRIPGCTTKAQHLFVGRKKDGEGEGKEEVEELKEVRSDFYQTASTVIASLYLKKVDKERPIVQFVDAEEGGVVELDLHTSDNKHYQSSMKLFGAIKAEESGFKIMGTKVELTIVKANNVGWPVLRAEDPQTGSIIQAGRAGRV